MSDGTEPRQRHTHGVPDRMVEVDALKAIGICAVVLIHSVRAPWDGGITPVEALIGQMTRFAVPAFFAASGYLYATRERISGAKTRQRVVRILVPYAVASVAGQIFWALEGSTKSIREMASELAFGASFGIYYYIPLILFFVLISPALARVPRRLLALLVPALLLIELLIETWVIPPIALFWYMRNPFLWAGYFTLGWWARLERERLREHVEAARPAVVSIAALVYGALVVSISLQPKAPETAALAWCAIVAALVALYAASAFRRSCPAWMRWMSDASYTLYLFHIFFVEALTKAVPFAPHRLEPGKIALYWTSGVLGTAGLVWLGRRLLGERSRFLLGA